jgi:hypothetical protein
MPAEKWMKMKISDQVSFSAATPISTIRMETQNNHFPERKISHFEVELALILKMRDFVGVTVEAGPKQQIALMVEAYRYA